MESDVKTNEVMVNDPAKIMRGMTTIFDGLHMMFGGITEQVELACQAMTDLGDTTEVEHSPAEMGASTQHAHSTEGTSAGATAAKNAVENKTTRKQRTAAWQKSAAGASDAVEESSASDQDNVTETAPPEVTTSPSAITKDTITQVVVSKIKKNRKNSEAIGKLVEVYGVAQLSDLPEEKYEAFLNDLSQL